MTFPSHFNNTLPVADKASLALSVKRKQKYQNGSIHRKLKVTTFVILSRPSIQYACIPAHDQADTDVPLEVLNLVCDNPGVPTGKSRPTAVASVSMYTPVRQCVRVLNLVHTHTHAVSKQSIESMLTVALIKLARSILHVKMHQ